MPILYAVLEYVLRCLVNMCLLKSVPFCDMSLRLYTHFTTVCELALALCMIVLLNWQTYRQSANNKNRKDKVCVYKFIRISVLRTFTFEHVLLLSTQRITHTCDYSYMLYLYYSHELFQ